MARSVGGWVAGSLALCVLLGVVYLPPRGMPKWAEGRIYALREPNQQRLRARELASKWQEANAAVLGAQYRDRVGPIVADREARQQAGPVLMIEVDDSLMDWARPVIQRGLDSAWQKLEIGLSKVSVGVLIRERDRKLSPLTRSSDNPFGPSYLLPDSTDRSTCLVVTRLPYFAVDHHYRPVSQLIDWGASTLGPCAWYARFGVPSRRVEQWLARRNFDVALRPRWYAAPEAGGMVNRFLFGQKFEQWWWGEVYSHPPMTMACFAGRPEDCRKGLAAPDNNGAGPRPRVVVPFDPWDARKVQLVGAEGFLSDVLRTVGEERFQEFWTTSLPVDSALTLAIGKPVGEYTVSWQRIFSVGPIFGASTTWLNAGLGFAFAALMTALVLFGQGRREVR